jgi:hypothetical protein
MHGNEIYNANATASEYTNFSMSDRGAVMNSVEVKVCAAGERQKHGPFSLSWLTAASGAERRLSLVASKKFRESVPDSIIIRAETPCGENALFTACTRPAARINTIIDH